MELNVVVGSDGSSSLEGDDFLYTKATYLIQPTTPPTPPTTTTTATTTIRRKTAVHCS